MDIIYVPITCAVCKRHSAMSLSKSEIKEKLATGEPIELHCGYDEEKWDASSKERLLMMKLCLESDAVKRVMSKYPQIQPTGMAAARSG
jgi:hypothetical protein